MLGHRLALVEVGQRLLLEGLDQHRELLARQNFRCRPAHGRPTPDPDAFMAFLPRIKQASDAVVNITTGGGHGMSLEERLAAPLKASPEMTSLNMGSMNFGLFPILDKMDSFQHEWERQHLEQTAVHEIRRGLVKIILRGFKTSEGDIEVLGSMADHFKHALPVNDLSHNVGERRTLALTLGAAALLQLPSRRSASGSTCSTS
mgnify:CR=1 FL=1